MTTSVALCTYNGAQYLKQQLDSILGQTRPVDEIVICDDRSTDGTVALVNRYVEKYPEKIRLIENPVNLGYTRNFEKAICACSGDIIFLSDQDDIWMPEKAETICDYFETHPDKSFVFTNAFLVNRFGAKSYHQTLFDTVGLDDRNKKLFRTGHQYQVLSTSGRVTGATTAMRASFVPYCIPFTVWGQVHDEMIAISALLWNKLDFIDRCLIKYRLHDSQSVGLGALFVYPAKRWETAKDILMWHRELPDPSAEIPVKRVGFVYKRFWALRSRFNLFKIVGMYCKGEYHARYADAGAMFLQDVKGVAVRFLSSFKRAEY